MGRGPVVAGRKATRDFARGKICAVHAKLIALCARGGSDPDDNPTLRDAMDKARKDSVPKDVIERAIRRGSGEDTHASEISEIVYEGYGAGGVAIIARCLSDNRNRTAANIRNIFSKNKGNLGEVGSLIGHMFDLRGMIEISDAGEREEMIILGTSALDYETYLTGFRVFVSRDHFRETLDELQQAGIVAHTHSLEYTPRNDIEITDFDQAVCVVKLLQDLDADEDVERVWTNASMDDTLRGQVEDFIESRTFRS